MSNDIRIPPQPTPTLPLLDEERRSAAAIKEMREESLDDFYFFCRVILGYDDLVPHAHEDLCDFLQETTGFPRRMLLHPRSTFKSTIGSISYAIWRLARNPNLRILVISDTGPNASLFMAEVQNHFENNEVFRATFPEMIPDNFNNTTWNTEAMLIKSRTKVWKEPSVTAIGIRGGAESRHFDLIIADDVITEDAIRSDAVMNEAISRVGGFESLLVKPTDEILFIGSRKKRGDLYYVVEEKFGGGEEARDIGPHTKQRGELLIFSRTILNDDKTDTIFPEWVPLNFIERLLQTDPERANAQYFNNPIGTGVNFFSPETMQYFEWLPGPRGSHARIKLPDGRIINPFAMERLLICDPSKAEHKRSSKVALLVVAKGDGPERFILEAVVKHIQPDVNVDELLRLYDKWRPSSVVIEHRGYQGSLKYWLNERAEDGAIPYLPIVEWPMKGAQNAQWSKVERIRGMIPMFNSLYVWQTPDLKTGELREELTYYPNVTWDDGVDGLAMCMDFWPYMIGEARRTEKRDLEDQWLEDVLGYVPDRGAFDEMEMLRQIDATGYGMKLHGDA